MKGGETDREELGLEIEHFVLDDNGYGIGFDEVSALIAQVADDEGARIHYMDGYPVGYSNERYAVSLEPSCQFEISISPYAELSKIQAVYEEFRAIWEPLFAARGYHFETKGNHPLVEQSIITPDEINKAYRKEKRPLTNEERIRVIEAAIHTIVPGNKLNLMLYDGELFYLHKNEQGTMYRKMVPGGAMFATLPLDQGKWTEVPENRLLVYQDGQLLYIGERHTFSYIHNEEHMKLLYLAYSAL